MTPEQTRDSLIDAVQRDLRGPLADPTGAYPGATPTRLDRGQNIETDTDLHRLFVADDGEEVLTERPTARYIVGALYPVMHLDEERDPDEAQAPPATDEAGNDADEIAPRPGAPDAAADSADSDDDGPASPVDRPGRPSSFGISFVVADEVATLTLRVAGARYEPHEYLYRGSQRTGWHRVAVNEEVPLQLPADGVQVKEVIAKPLQLHVGIHSRHSDAGQRIVTCYLVNRTSQPEFDLARRVLFTARLTAVVPAEHLLNYPDRNADSTAEAASLRLLYTDVPVRAVGHGVDAVVAIDGDVALVHTESLPVAAVGGTTPNIADAAGSLNIDMDGLGYWDPAAVATVDRMIASYREWIKDRSAETAKLDGPERDTAEEHMRACEAFADDVAAGWALASAGTVQRCLRWTSTAMAQQRRSYGAPTRSVTVSDGVITVEGTEPGSKGLAQWRPFQLAFVLANLAQIIDPKHHRRGVVDVIWMPTGGGKTEAYLALAAFTMLFSRLTEPNRKGTAVIMRYTLRLLTAQQLQRAASLMCALETLRTDNRDVLGPERFSIGAWLGRASTPNWRKDAVTELRNFARSRDQSTTDRPFILSRCPACAAAIGDVCDGRVLGYGVHQIKTADGTGYRMQASCPNPACAFHLSRTRGGLPVYEVDEDIYDRPPTFLVATVDKFAQLAWNEKARVIFGLGERGSRHNPAPALIIQDELHLISGPLGSLVGLYEAAIDQLCRHDGGQAPHVVAATATTRAYARQAEALYACRRDEVRLVPPPGLSVHESFFAQADTANPPRTFVGVCATGVGRFAHAQMRVLASLAHAAAALEQQNAPVDPYWTNVAFFGSLRDLGLAKALISTDLRGYAWRLVRATGIRTGTLGKAGVRKAIRPLTDVELTSASSSAAAKALDQLGQCRDQPGAIDLALATSVIEVGVDVDRLGLLTIVRQPKTAAQYIQVAGRVGRNPSKGPGLVVVLLNPMTARDVSHYERFTAVHQRLYAAVESASVTPFTDAALARGLRGAFSSVVRQVRSRGIDRVIPTDVELVSAAAQEINRRATKIGGTPAGDRVSALSDVALNELRTAVDQQLGWGNAGQSGFHFLRPLEDPAPTGRASWPALTSLRSVDGDTALRIDENWLPARAGTDVKHVVPVGGTSDTAPHEEEW